MCTCCPRTTLLLYPNGPRTSTLLRCLPFCPHLASHVLFITTTTKPRLICCRRVAALYVSTAHTWRGAPVVSTVSRPRFERKGGSRACGKGYVTSRHNSTSDAKAEPWGAQGDLLSYGSDSEQQQEAVAAVAERDAFNWGYDPVHYSTPEGALCVSAYLHVTCYIIHLTLMSVFLSMYLSASRGSWHPCGYL